MFSGFKVSFVFSGVDTLVNYPLISICIESAFSLQLIVACALAYIKVRKLIRFFKVMNIEIKAITIV